MEGRVSDEPGITNPAARYDLYYPTSLVLEWAHLHVHWALNLRHFEASPSSLCWSEGRIWGGGVSLDGPLLFINKRSHALLW